MSKLKQRLSTAAPPPSHQTHMLHVSCGLLPHGCGAAGWNTLPSASAAPHTDACAAHAAQHSAALLTLNCMPQTTAMSPW